MSIQEKINQIIENFSYFDNWENRYEYLIDLGKKLPKIDEDLKINEFRVQGCTSNLWVIPEINKNIINFKGASDSVIVQGLFAIFGNADRIIPAHFTVCKSLSDHQQAWCSNTVQNTGIS